MDNGVNRTRIVWFCNSCEAANVFHDEKFSKDDLDCQSCNSPMVAESLIYDIDRMVGDMPIRHNASKRLPISPYFKDGGVAVRGEYNAIWSND